MIFESQLLGITLAHWLVVVSACISLSGSSIYIRDTLRGTTKPNRVSYLLWSLAPSIGVVAALSANADGWATVRIFMSGFIPFLIFLSSFVNPMSYWKLDRFDLLCGIFSLIALAIWGVPTRLNSQSFLQLSPMDLLVFRH